MEEKLTEANLRELLRMAETMEGSDGDLAKALAETLTPSILMLCRELLEARSKIKAYIDQFGEDCLIDPD